MKDAQKELLAMLVEYEVAGSWWSGFVSWNWAQHLAAKWHIRKTKRKFARFMQHQEFRLAMQIDEIVEKESP